MGATYVTCTVRNPAEPDRAWEGLFFGGYWCDGLFGAQAALGIDWS